MGWLATTSSGRTDLAVDRLGQELGAALVGVRPVDEQRILHVVVEVAEVERLGTDGPGLGRQHAPQVIGPGCPQAAVNLTHELELAGRGQRIGVQDVGGREPGAVG